MLNLTLKRLSVAIFFVASNLSAVPLKCKDLLAFLAAYPDRQELGLLPGPFSNNERRGLAPVFWPMRLSDVYIQLDGRTDAELKRISSLIARGCHLSVTEVEQRLIQWRNEKPSVQFSLVEFLPSSVRDTVLSVACFVGVNCVRSVDNWHASSPNLTFLHPSEMQSILSDSHSYRRLARGTERQIGDVIVLRARRRQGREIVHAVIYLGDGLVWHKPSVSGGDPETFDTLEHVVNSHPGSTELSVYRFVETN